ncbi:MAG: hypothetical protein ACYC77_00505 [Coriobacteriia bacterium]
MRRARIAHAIVFALLLTVALPAATATAAASPWKGISVTLFDLDPDKTPTLVVYGSLADEVTLPVVVELPVPAGSEIGWVGEFLGGDPANDPTAEYEVVRGTDADILRITVTTAHAVQAELVPPAGVVVDDSGTRTVSLRWVARETAQGARLGLVAPNGYHATRVIPSPTIEGDASGAFYWVETSPLKAGDELTLSATLARGLEPSLAPAESTATVAATATAAPAATTPGSDPVTSGSSWKSALIALLASALGAAVIALVFVIRRRQSAGSQ